MQSDVTTVTSHNLNNIILTACDLELQPFLARWREEGRKIVSGIEKRGTRVIWSYQLRAETMVTDVTLHPETSTKDLIKEFYPSQGILTVAIVTTIR